MGTGLVYKRCLQTVPDSNRDAEMLPETKGANEPISFSKYLPKAKRLDFTELSVRPAGDEDYKYFHYNDTSNTINYLCILLDGYGPFTCTLSCCPFLPVEWDRDLNASLVNVDTLQTPALNKFPPCSYNLGRTSSLVRITSPDGKYEMIANSILRRNELCASVRMVFGLADAFTFDTSQHFHFAGEWYSGWRLTNHQSNMHLLVYEINTHTKIKPVELITVIANYVGTLSQSHDEFKQHAPPEWFQTLDVPDFYPGTCC